MTVSEAPGAVVLELAGIDKRFGALHANAHIDLSLREGEVLALLGENGAGKTTLMNILFGHYVADGGEVRVAGAQGLEPLPGGSPAAALAAGIGMVHQHFTLAENLSGFENIVLGTEPVLRLWRRAAQARERVEQTMAESGLAVDLDAPVERLSVGEKQRVEILKALYRRVRVLVLDEPTAVLTPQEAEGLFAVLRRLTSRGLAVIFISHKLNEVLAISGRIAVLRAGRKVGEVAAREADRRLLAELMVGREVPAGTRAEQASGAPVLQLSSVDAGTDTSRALREATLAVHAGEIVGVAGVSGNGQAALAALVAGLEAPAAGEMRLFGEPVRRHSPRAFVARAIARIPEDRHRDGIVGSMSVAENLVIEDVRHRDYQRAGFLRFGAVRRRAEAAIRDYDVRCPGPDAPARLLSGGNMQKLILARVLARGPRLILANQPSRGLDVGAQADVHRRLLAARAAGAAVLLISEDLDELLQLSDRVLVMHRGRVTDAGPTAQLDRARVGLLMAGHGDAAPG